MTLHIEILTKTIKKSELITINESVRLQGRRSIYKYQFYFYTLEMMNQK